MSNLTKDLNSREANGRPITVAIVGAGQMGRGLVSSLELISGMQPSLVVDIVVERARQALLDAGVLESSIVFAHSVEESRRALSEGLRVIGEDPGIIPGDGIEAVVEATGIPEIGARVALDSISRRQHIVMLNVETDVTIGRLLRHLAELAGVVYSVSAGDEPGATVELVEFARTLGFEVVAAGKGKNNSLDPWATPQTVEDEARRKGASPHMFCSFVDGTKTMVEMTAVANATGLVPQVPGMLGLSLRVEDLAKTFRLKSQGGVLNQTGVVDFVHGIAPGVFAVVTSKSDVIRQDMEYLKAGDGPNWTLYRPYHLANLETPHTIAKAVLYHDTCLVPGDRPVAETVAMAKRDLEPGERLDDIGGYTVRGHMMRYEESLKMQALPVGIAQGATVKHPVKQGDILRYDSVSLDDNALVVQLRRLQDRLWSAG